ncbi:hypothetical protein [Gelatiniphilus marinus]|uniref:Uncharacterized protein n=1 Tax=Gelatiniphilus marinus TaxID=1759464 RepID=A0ABW5JQG0_9FLAO
MKNKPAITYYTFLFACLLGLLSTGKAEAQEHGIFELTANETRSNLSANKTKKNNRIKFYNLYQNLHTTAYLSNKTISNVYGKDKIKKLNFEDTRSFGLLDKQTFDEAELITIKVKKLSDLSNRLDLTTNEKLSNLKYVFVKCYFKCTAQQIEKFVKVKSNSNIRIFYKTESPS